MDWTPTDTIVLVEGGYKGVTATPAEVTKLIEDQGWTVNNVKWTKDSYVAQATNPHGEKKDAKGPTSQDALAQLLLIVYKLNASRASASRLAAITHEWLQLINDVSEVAQAYSKLPAYDMKASLAWHELSVDSKRRAAEIHRQLKVEVVDNPQPYPTAVEMFQDIRKKKHVFISRANVDHPLWSMEDVINFRLVHMVMGFAAADAPFGYAGEVMASSAHAQLLSANAKRALLTDRVGQSAYGYFYGHFVPKIAFMGDIEKLIGLEGDTATGVHPSQTIVPAEIPKFSKILIAAYVTDPNANYQTGVSPLSNNAYQWQGDPLDAHDEGGMMDTAGKAYTGWDNMKNADGTDDYATMKQAVVNALRVVLLSPRKDLKWNCHDDQTQALTDRGWISYKTLRRLWQSGDDFKVAAFDNGTLVYERPERMIVQKYEGDLLSFSGRFTDFLVTPDHRMLMDDGRLIPAIDVPIDRGLGRGGYGPLIPTSGKIGGMEVSEFTIPGCDQREPRLGCKPIEDRAQYPALSIPMDCWLDWLGWYVSEGCLTSRNHPSVSQKKTSATITEVRSACSALDIGTSVIRPDNQWVWTARAPYAKPLGKWLKEHVGDGARNKYLPKFVFDLPASQAQIFLRSLLMGDGTADGQWNSETGVCFSTSSTRLAHDVHRLSLHCGYRSHLRISRSETNEWIVGINPGKPTHLPRPTVVAYNGDVWCFTMPSGTLVTRRNGKIGISGNCVHYQHIQNVPADTDDPKRYWDTLEEQRENWNQARGYAAGSHKAYWKAQQQFHNYIRNLHPDESEQLVKAIADREFQNIWVDLEEELTEDPKNSNKTADEIERKVGREIDKRVQRILSPIKDEEAPDEQMSMFGARPAPDQEDFSGNQAQKYGAWMGAHMKALAQVSQHADELTRAALQDARSGGEGYHFRQTLLGLGVSGVGPKVASFAWLLLKPQTSQLATIDTHMLDTLGHDEGDLNDRDYYRMERELAAGRDAAGYSGVPLGAFQWGMWDAKRTGLGTHQDHSAMKVLNPVSHDLIDWNHKQGDASDDALKNDPRWQWWRDTEPARQQVVNDWQKDQATKFPQNSIPGQPLQNTPDPNTPEGMYAMDEASRQGQQPVTAAIGKDKEEFCILCPLKPKDALDVYSWVCEQEWPEGTELEDPDDYHVTLLYSPTGFSDNANHIWAKTRSQGGFPVTTGDLDLFGPDKDVLVIRLTGDELTEFTDSMQEEALSRGLNISQFEDGYKPHMTIAKGVKTLPSPPPKRTVRLDNAVVSLPRTKIRFSYTLKTPWHINDGGDMMEGNPGQSVMDHLRSTYAMTPEQVWQSGIEEVGKR